MKQTRTLLSALFLLPCFAGLVLLPREVSAAVTEGLRLCAGVILPALFPFLVLSSLTVTLGLAEPLGRLLSPVTGRLLHITPAGTGALTLGLLGGYPVGARAVRQLWETGQCSYEECVRLLAFCNNCGPAFLLGVAGNRVFGSVRMGLLLWTAHLLGALTVGVLFRGVKTEGEERSGAEAPCSVRCFTFAEALTESVQSGLHSTLSICAYVVLFRVVLCLAEAAGLPALWTGLVNGRALMGGILEMSTGVTAVRASARGAAPLVSFLLGFGGLSVWCQTLAMLAGSGLDSRYALLGKLLHGGCAALWTAVLLAVVPLSVETAAVAAVPMAKNGLAWLPMTITGGSWGFFVVWFRDFVRLDSRNQEKNHV